MTKIQKTKNSKHIIKPFKNITFQILWTKKEQKPFCWDLGMTEKEQKGLKLISLSLVLGTLLDKNIYGRKGNNSFVGND